MKSYSVVRYLCTYEWRCTVYLAVPFLLVQGKEDLKIVPHGTLNINIQR